jgi:PEP-CTERM motif-containing protein
LLLLQWRYCDIYTTFSLKVRILLTEKLVYLYSGCIFFGLSKQGGTDLRQKKLALATVCIVVFGFVALWSANATELLTNGGFETGSFLGWTVADLAGGNGSWFVDSALSTPLSGNPSVGPNTGSYYAVSDQTGPGTHALSQTFTVPALGGPVILSFDMFVNDWDSGPFVNPGGLDHNLFPNQHARVDILASGASAFDTGAGVLANYYLGVDPQGLNPNPYTSYALYITGVVGAGGNFTLRFAEVDNQLFFNQGVDNASIQVGAAGEPVPEPGTLLLLSTGLAGLAGYGKLKLKRKKKA